MSFAPVRLGNTVLEAETAAADRKSCRRFGPCGVGEKALYLNDLLIDRHFYVGFGSVRRVFKRVAMSQGGFSGKGAFGSIPYLVVQYDDGQEKQCTFKREEDVDELLAYLGQVHPEIPRLSVGGEQRLAKKAQQEASRYLKELTPQAQSAREELERALDVAASYDRRILVEVGVVHPVEINCAAVGYGEDVRASVCEMPVPSSNDTFLDFWQKYLRNASTKGEDSRGMKSLSRVVPAPIGDELTGRIQTMTCDIFKLLDCCGTVRVDFILDQNDMLFVNEPNTIPGSLAFYLWKASGLDFPKLIEKMVEDALRAHADKNSSVFAYDSSILKKVAAGTKGSKR